jgi:phage internal scaffolding protein
MTKKSNVIQFRTAYTPPKKVQFNTEGESLTQQHFAEDTMVNNIIKKYDKDGIILHVNRGTALYGDFSKVTDFTEALEIINQAKDSFSNIPSEIRKQFDNDAGKFYQFVSNPKNKDEIIKLGLATERVVDSVREKKESVTPVVKEKVETTPEVSTETQLPT